MRKPPPATLFDVAGLAEQATPVEIDARWQEVFRQSGGDLAAISADVRNAFRVLQAPQNVELYRDLLRSCREETNIPVREAEIDTFTRFCAMCLITPFRHPKQRELFAVCLAGQTVPPWAHYDPNTMSHLRVRWGQRLEYWIQLYLLGGVFRNRTRGQRVGISLAYLAAVALLVLAGRSMIVALAPIVSHRIIVTPANPHSDPPNTPVSQPAVDFAAIAATCERARSNLRHIDEQIATADREFERVAGTKLSDAAIHRNARPEAIDVAIAKDPDVKETWFSILDVYTEPATLQEKRTAAEAVLNRATKKESPVADDADARQLETWTRNLMERLRGQRNSIEHLRVMLKEDRFENALNQPDGSKP